MDIPVVNFNGLITKSQILRTYGSEVRRKVKQMDWDSLTNILTSQPEEIKMDQGESNHIQTIELLSRGQLEESDQNRQPVIVGAGFERTMAKSSPTFQDSTVA
jgi:hypothetical protein